MMKGVFIYFLVFLLCFFAKRRFLKNFGSTWKSKNNFL